MDNLKLCIAEKPSVGKELARILGASSRKDGYYEGNGYLVSWTFGHLCTLKAPDDYTEKWKRWNLNYLPMIPERFGIKLIDNSGIKKQFSIVESLVKRCTEVINCGDAGIEGEVIQRWVLHKAKCKVPVKRLWISSLTDEAIRDGFKNLRESSDFDLLYAAGNARAIGDWLLGMNASRLFTLKYANNKGVLSIGRVQTPTLALIVNRYNEIQNFVSQTFWEIRTKYKEVYLNSTKGRFTNEEEAKNVIETIKEKEFEIVSFTKKKGKEYAPKLFDLTSLQVECNKMFSFTADETLKLIQQLYEKKLVTYPRVDTTYLPDDMYPKIKGILEKLKPYEKFTSQILSDKIKKSKKVFDNKKVTDHHAIIPTGIFPNALNLQEKQVYDIITRRFIAAFFPESIISNTTVIGKVDKFEFKATGKVILEPGWRVLYPKKSTDKKDDSQIMPIFEKGEKGEHSPDLQEKQTQPPKLYTEASLLRAMESAGKQIDDEELAELMKENGIGRPSTRANIIETLFRRKYVSRVKKNLVPTVTGIELIATIKNDLLKSVELTGLWEKKLRQIEKNEYDVAVFLTEMKKMVNEIVYEVKHETYKTITIEEEKPKKSIKTDKNKTTNTKEIICPKCKKGTIIKGKTAYGCSNYKNGCNLKVDFKIYNKKLTEKQILRLIQKGKTTNIKGFTIDSNKTEGKLIFDDNYNIVLETKDAKPNKIKEGDTCPKCKKGKIIKGKTALGCNRYNEGCNFRADI